MRKQPEVIHPKGDWFFGVRLPEYRCRWEDADGAHHSLEVIGRHIRCDIHYSSPMRGIIHFEDPDGTPDTQCAELSRMWPKFFTAGDDFCDFRELSRAPVLQPESTISAIRRSILATMIDAIANELFVREVPEVLQKQLSTYVSRGVSFHTRALRALQNVPSLGKSKHPHGDDTPGWVPTQITQATLGSFQTINKFKIALHAYVVPRDWWQSPSLETIPDSESSIGI